LRDITIAARYFRFAGFHAGFRLSDATFAAALSFTTPRLSPEYHFWSPSIADILPLSRDHVSLVTNRWYRPPSKEYYHYFHTHETANFPAVIQAATAFQRRRAMPRTPPLEATLRSFHSASAFTASRSSARHSVCRQIAIFFPPPLSFSPFRHAVISLLFRHADVSLLLSSPAVLPPLTRHFQIDYYFHFLHSFAIADFSRLFHTTRAIIISPRFHFAITPVYHIFRLYWVTPSIDYWYYFRYLIAAFFFFFLRHFFDCHFHFAFISADIYAFIFFRY